jgi:hypothetical protein
MEKTLSFSEPFLNVEHIAYEDEYEITNKSIILNVDLDPLFVEDVELPPLGSIICGGVSISKVRNILVISIEKGDYFGNNQSLDREIITNNWYHVYDLFNVPHLEKTTLWRSEKEKVTNFEFNLWYAPAGTHCGIHNHHDFQELHTQIYGVGRMQKFYRNDFNSLYQEIFMSPGYTHDPFYSPTGEYPWHQYYADTDCIWLAIEKH